MLTKLNQNRMDQISGLQYMERISGVVNYVNQTFSLFSEVEKVRPKKILKLDE